MAATSTSVTASTINMRTHLWMYVCIYIWQELKQTYIKRKETMRQQIQSVSVEHETLKKSLNANDVARELDETEKRLKHYERSIFDLKDFVDTKSRETDYGNCFLLVSTSSMYLLVRSLYVWYIVYEQYVCVCMLGFYYGSHYAKWVHY